MSWQHKTHSKAVPTRLPQGTLADTTKLTRNLGLRVKKEEGVDLAPYLGDEDQVRLPPAMAFTPTRSPGALRLGCAALAARATAWRTARESPPPGLSPLFSLSLAPSDGGKNKT
jgi:hypothetical protein